MNETRALLSLGFARGTSPGKWAERWERATGAPLELVPLALAFGWDPDADVSVMLERTRPGERPEGSLEPRTRHAVRLYEETLALVVPHDHELAGQDRASLDDISLAGLLDHADHSPEWPATEPWADPAWKPADPAAALEAVATGAGSILLPLPLARHLAGRREHSVIPVDDAAELPGTAVWATWSIGADDTDIQHLVGVMRGRTARSSR